MSERENVGEAPVPTKLAVDMALRLKQTGVIYIVAELAPDGIGAGVRIGKTIEMAKTDFVHHHWSQGELSSTAFEVVRSPDTKEREAVEVAVGSRWKAKDSSPALVVTGVVGNRVEYEWTNGCPGVRGYQSDGSAWLRRWFNEVTDATPAPVPAPVLDTPFPLGSTLYCEATKAEYVYRDETQAPCIQCRLVSPPFHGPALVPDLKALLDTPETRQAALIAKTDALTRKLRLKYGAVLCKGCGEGFDRVGKSGRCFECWRKAPRKDERATSQYTVYTRFRANPPKPEPFVPTCDDPIARDA